MPEIASPNPNTNHDGTGPDVKVGQLFKEGTFFLFLARPKKECREPLNST